MFRQCGLYYLLTYKTKRQSKVSNTYLPKDRQTYRQNHIVVLNIHTIVLPGLLLLASDGAHIPNMRRAVFTRQPAAAASGGPK